MIRTSVHRAVKHLRNTESGSPTFLMEAAPELPEPEYLREDRRDWMWPQTALTTPSINHKHAVTPQTTTNTNSPVRCVCSQRVRTSLRDRSKKKKRDIIKELRKTLHASMHTPAHLFCASLSAIIISCSVAFACAVYSILCFMVSPYRYVLKT